MCPDARVHYVVLKQQPRQPHPPHTNTRGVPAAGTTRNTRIPRIAAKRPCCLRTQQCAKHNPATNTPDRFPNNPPTQKCEKELPYSRQDTTTNRPCQKLDLLIFHP